MSRHHKEVVAFVLIGISSMSIEDEVFLGPSSVEKLNFFLYLLVLLTMFQQKHNLYAEKVRIDY